MSKSVFISANNGEIEVAIGPGNTVGSAGTPEALSIKDSIGFCLAVQWHPEWNASCDNVSKPLFQNFGKNLRLPSN